MILWYIISKAHTILANGQRCINFGLLAVPKHHPSAHLELFKSVLLLHNSLKIQIEKTRFRSNSKTFSAFLWIWTNSWLELVILSLCNIVLWPDGMSIRSHDTIYHEAYGSNNFRFYFYNTVLKTSQPNWWQHWE